MITDLIADFKITQINFAVIPSSKKHREAFILFSNADDIESALLLDNEKFGEIFTELYRSSLVQMEFYCRIGSPSNSRKSDEIKLPVTALDSNENKTNSNESIEIKRVESKRGSNLRS